MSVAAEEAIAQLLLDDAAVSALVDTEIYPLLAPHTATYPYITYQRISAEHFHHTTAASGTVKIRVQFDIWSDDWLEVKDLAEKARLALVGRPGGNVTVDVETLYVAMIWLEGQTDGFERVQDGGDTGAYRVSQDYIVGHPETVPTFA